MIYILKGMSDFLCVIELDINMSLLFNKGIAKVNKMPSDMLIKMIDIMIMIPFSISI